MSVATIASILAAEDPTKTHHWLLPETAEMVYGIPASLIVFYMLYRFGWPAMKKGLEGRTARIQKDLDHAAASRAAADTEAARIRTALGDIEAERARLMSEADAEASRLLSEGRARLEQEAVDLEARADAEAAHLVSRGSDELRGEISQLAAAASEQLVAAELDEATHQQLIEAFIARVGAAR
jgi:F-type H+-transporting ATPase subunit b